MTKLPLPFDRDQLGRLVRHAYVAHAESLPNPSPKHLALYDELPKVDQDAAFEMAAAVANAVVATLWPADNAHTPHADNDAVDLLANAMLATAMKTKLGRARDKGRGGWDDQTACSNADLSRMLRQHVDKGDPVDVANFCAFLFARGERILPDPADGVAQDRDALLSFLGYAPGPLGDRREIIRQFADILFSNLFNRNRLEHLLRILRPLKWTDLGVLSENPENRAQLEQLAEFMFNDALSRATAKSAAEDKTDRCPICAEPLKAGDTCATDITEGTCHAACLDGAAVVDLATGEPSEGPISTFPYQPEERDSR